MKKIITLIILLLSVAGCFSQNKGESIIDSEVKIIPVGPSMVPFKNKSTEKFGFCNNNSELAVIVIAEYDDVYVDYKLAYEIYPVKKNGKWGAICSKLTNDYSKVIIGFSYKTPQEVINVYKLKKM